MVRKSPRFPLRIGDRITVRREGQDRNLIFSRRGMVYGTFLMETPDVSATLKSGVRFHPSSIIRCAIGRAPRRSSPSRAILGRFSADPWQRQWPPPVFLPIVIHKMVLASRGKMTASTYLRYSSSANRNLRPTSYIIALAQRDPLDWWLSAWSGVDRKHLAGDCASHPCAPLTNIARLGVSTCGFRAGHRLLQENPSHGLKSRGLRVYC